MSANSDDAGRTTEVLKSWVMVVLTLLFVLLYGAAFIGRLRPWADFSMVSRLEALIFVLIGYYFGRLPGQQNEKTLKEEIRRQTLKADAAQNLKEKAQQSREVMEEKIRSARAALTSVSSMNLAGDSLSQPVASNTIQMTINILNS